MRPRRVPAPLVDASLVAVSLLDVWIHVDTDEPGRMGVALLACCALALRRRLPLPVFLLTLPTTLVSDAVFATLVALYTLASLTRHRLLLAICALVLVRHHRLVVALTGVRRPVRFRPPDHRHLQPGDGGRSRVPRPTRPSRT